MQEIEFTVEDGQLFILETKAAQRTAKAAVHVAVSMVIEGVVTEREALLGVDPRLVEGFQYPMVKLPTGERFDSATSSQTISSHLSQSTEEEGSCRLHSLILVRGLAASPGAVSGKVVFSATEAVNMHKLGEPCILCVYDVAVEDLAGLQASTPSNLLVKIVSN